MLPLGLRGGKRRDLLLKSLVAAFASLAAFLSALGD
jgi:hypothetical protein